MDVDSFYVMQRNAIELQEVGAAVDRTVRDCRMLQRLPQESTCGGAWIADQVFDRTGSDHLAAAHTGGGSQIEDVVGSPDGLLVVLHDHQGIALSGKLRECIEENLVVPGMQPDGRLVQHIADALQVGAELGREADTLSLAARQGGCGAVQLQVSQSHAVEEPEAGAQLREQVARDLRFTRIEIELRKKLTGLRDSLSREIRDRAVAKAHIERDRAEPLACAGTAGSRIVLVPFVPPDLLAALLRIETCHFHAGAVTALAPAVLRVEGEQSWIQLGEAAAAGRARPFRRQHRHAVRFWSENMDDALPEIERPCQCCMQCRIRSCSDLDLGDGQLDRVLLES